MFLTGFSSPFISIFLAVVLPWLIIIFGKETSQQIISDAKVIFHIEEVSGKKEIDLQESYTFTAVEKTSIQKQVSTFCKPGKNYIASCIFEPDYSYPANDTIFETLVSRNSGNRAPPFMFTI